MRTAANVAAFGDSLMWGQGLRRQNRFTALVTNQMAAEFGKQTARVVHDLSRSGAQINARESERATFVDRFTFVLDTPLQRTRLLSGVDETPASKLYGEVPSALPTVVGQVAAMKNAVGRAVDLALVDGGVNDLAIEDIINPQVDTGQFIERFDGEIRRVAHDDVLDLLRKVRAKCPRALICYFGFFAPLSEASSTSKIRDLFKHEYNDDVAWFFNQYIWEVRDVDALISEGITRAMWFQGRFQYWTTQAVAAANRDAAIRGPGVAFVPSGFGAANSAFARTPFLFEDYTDPTGDPAREKRVEKCPRYSQHGLLKTLVSQGLAHIAIRGITPLPVKAATEAARAIDGPERLQSQLGNFIADPGEVTLNRVMREAIPEVGRIQRAMIASLSHPNEKGAASYATQAVTRIGRRRAINIAIETEKLGGPPATADGQPLTATLGRYRLRGTGSVHADICHLDVDSLAVGVVTAPGSTSGFRPDVHLFLKVTPAGALPGGVQDHRTEMRFRLNFRYELQLLPLRVKKLYPHFEPGATNRLTVATDGNLRLTRILSSAIVIGDDPFGGAGGAVGAWEPQHVELEVNGARVVQLDLAGQTFAPGSHLDLGWPAADPGFQPPNVPPVALKKVRPLVPKSLPKQPAMAAVLKNRPSDAARVPVPAVPGGDG